MSQLTTKTCSLGHAVGYDNGNIDTNNHQSILNPILGGDKFSSCSFFNDLMTISPENIILRREEHCVIFIHAHFMRSFRLGLELS